ncbi:LIM and SH3 domain protein 1 [Tyrophagus putrescentiae]|nr:LIM and SH3 domain protein 1 [Tyrophagus putrescentiae]
MSKKCARCEKTVYPIEELKCLDKIWHKSCFKCDECGMVLNMKTYKGFNKLPYCNAHTPVARATTVADTPENRRLAENTKIQSQVKYHADFEQQKGKVTQVADDPETLRIRNTSKIISNVTYHGDYEKKKQMEQRRNLLENENGNIPPMYIPVDKATTKNMTAFVNNNNNNNVPAAPQQPVLKNTAIDYHQRNAAPYGAYGNNNGNPAPVQSAKVTTAIPANPNANYLTDHQRYVNSQIAPQMAPQQYHHQPPPQQQQQPQYHQQPPMQPQHQQHLPQHHQQPPMQPQQQAQQLSHDSRYYSGVQHQQQQPPPQQQNVARPYGGATNLGRCFRAIYDYTAQDVDEVSFIDGDLIIHCQPIDDGWMTGTVQRSGQTGMLPSNYVETA